MRKDGIGVQGEELAAQFLKDKEYEILERNYISRFGEIDIIAKKDEYICFVEVKTRKHESLERPEFFVDNLKQKKLILTADVFLSNNETFANLQPRFDCVFVFFNEKEKTFSLNLCENAFYIE